MGPTSSPRAYSTVDGAGGTRAVLVMSMEEASAVEALLACVDEIDHPELAAATWFLWFAMQELRESEGERWNFDYSPLAEKALQRVRQESMMDEDDAG